MLNKLAKGVSPDRFSPTQCKKKKKWSGLRGYMSPEDQTVECAVYSVKNKLAYVARRQLSELFENMLVQAVLSLLASVKPIFRINKHYGLKP